jgi:hypothetical protein
MPYTFICLVRGAKHVTLVDIEGTMMVGHLEEQIKNKPLAGLGTYTTTALDLYQVEINASSISDAINEADTLFQGLSTSVPLNPTAQLDTIFGPSGPKGGYIHILVLHPGCESLGPRVWCHC